MKKFRIIYLPHGREDKEWVDVVDVSKESAIQSFKAGILISISEEED